MAIHLRFGTLTRAARKAVSAKRTDEFDKLAAA